MSTKFFIVTYRGFQPRSLGYFCHAAKVTKNALRPVGRPRAALGLGPLTAA